MRLQITYKEDELNLASFTVLNSWEILVRTHGPF
jgi:hypothetical protein